MQCPWRPGEDIRSSGVGVTKAMSQTMWVLGSELGSSARKVDGLCFYVSFPDPGMVFHVFVC